MTSDRSILSLSVLVLIGCASPGLFAEETVGERFRKVLAEIDESCRHMKMGPYLDPSDPEYRIRRRGTDCDILKLEPRDWSTEKTVQTEGQQYPIPERWLATPEGHFAHSIKLPAPHNEPMHLYRSGMSGLEYFQALCKEEAGEFIFDRIENVEGLRIDRAKTHHPPGYRDLVFYTNEWSALSVGRPESLVRAGRDGYEYIEIRLPASDARSRKGNFVRISYAAVGTGTREEMINTPKASYLATWRGIRRPNDWEHGIYGHEIIVLQKEPPTVIGFKRSFTRYEPFGTRDSREVFPRPCPSEVGKLVRAGEKFVLRALIPGVIR